MFLRSYIGTDISRNSRGIPDFDDLANVQSLVRCSSDLTIPDGGFMEQTDINFTFGTFTNGNNDRSGAEATLSIPVKIKVEATGGISAIPPPAYLVILVMIHS